jgi:hypothetical protein
VSSTRTTLLAVSCLSFFNTLNAELNPICHLLALLGVHFFQVSRIRVKSFNFTAQNFHFILFASKLQHMKHREDFHVPLFLIYLN